MTDGLGRRCSSNVIGWGYAQGEHAWEWMGLPQTNHSVDSAVHAF